MMSLFNYSFNIPSIIFGAAIASLIWLILWGIIRLTKQSKTVTKEIKTVIDKNRRLDIRDAYLQWQFDISQKYHLASQLFALEEVLVEPRIITPPAVINPLASNPPYDALDELLPFLPECCDIVSQYLVHSISLTKVLNSYGNSFFYGSAGSGKSTCLAALCLKLIKIASAEGAPIRPIPLLIHINNINWRKEPSSDFSSLLIDSIKYSFPRSSHKELEKFFLQQLSSTNFTLLLDGMDELSPEELKQLSTILGDFVLNNPGVRIITTAYGKSVGFFLNLHFKPFLLAAWKTAEIQQYKEKWKAALLEDNTVEFMDTDDVSLSWILPERRPLSPFEWTLRLWSFTCKDTIGIHLVDLLQQFIQRSGVDTHKKQLGKLAKNLLEAKISCTNQSEVSVDLFQSCVSASILRVFQNNYVSFFSPIFTGYFSEDTSKKALISSLSKALDWSYSFEYIRNISNPELDNALVFQEETDKLMGDIFHSPLIHRIFSLTQKNRPAKQALFKKTYSSIFQNDTPYGSKLQLVSAFLLHEEQDNLALLRQLIRSESSIIRSIAAICIGGIHEEQLIPELEQSAANSEGRELFSALLALGQFEKASTVSIVLEILIHGNEHEKNAASVALASGSTECHNALKQAVKMDDILVRKAAIKGIALIQEEWVKDFLKEISIDEKQWIVKNEAVAALEGMDSSENYPVEKYVPPHQAEWLIQYASSKGVGISPSKPPLALFKEIINSGTVEEKMAVLDHLIWKPDKDSTDLIMDIFSNTEDGILREKSAYCLWYLSHLDVIA